MIMKYFSYYKAKRKFIIFIFILIIIFLPYIKHLNLFNTNLMPDPYEMTVHYIDVGQGDSILIQVNNKNLLIDSGPKESKDKILKYLSSLSIEKLDYVIATHPHEDHIGNMADIIDSYSISAFYAPKVTTSTKSFEDMITSLKSKNLKINIIKKGTNSINLGEHTRINIFSPISDTYENLNNYSPLIKIEYGSTSFLFTGDGEADLENEIISCNDSNLSSDVLKIGHHGSSTSTSDEFLKEVNPSIAVISVGKNNIYNHPDKETISKLKKYKIKIFRTDIDGTVVLTSNGKTINKKTVNFTK